MRIGVTTDIAIASSETLQVEIPQAQNDLTAKFIRNRCGPAESDEVREAKALLGTLHAYATAMNAHKGSHTFVPRFFGKSTALFA